MKNKLNVLTIISILSITILGLAGVILILFPKESMNLIAYTIAAVLMVLGISLILRSTNETKIFDTTTLGVCLLLPGIIIVLYPTMLTTIIPIIVGMLIIINSVIKVRISLSFKEKSNKYYLLVSTSFLQLLIGIVLIVNPTIAQITLTALMGILLIFYSVNEIFNILMLRNYADKVLKFFE